MKRYNIVRTRDGRYRETEETYNSIEEAVDALERHAKYIADTFDAENKEWIEDEEQLDCTILDCIKQEADNWVRQYNKIKDDFAPGLWLIEHTMEPYLIYRKGSYVLSYDNYTLEVVEEWY